MIKVSLGLMFGLGIAGVVLLCGSAVRLVYLRGDGSECAVQRRRSLIVWWVLLLGFSAALVLGKAGLSVFFCLAGLLALREFQRLHYRQGDEEFNPTWMVAGVGIAHYLLLVFTDKPWALGAFPLLAIVCISAPQILNGQIHGYQRAVGGYVLAALLLFWGPSHFVALMHLSGSNRQTNEWLQVGSAGWPLLVVLLTEVDDIAQALFGRRWGHHQMTPAVSPGKTWEGFACGLAVTVILSLALVPWLTTLTEGKTTISGFLISMGVGIVVSLVGFLGDVNVSAMKREAGAKDSGKLLPGMGGMMDRIDSLSLTGPAFYYYAIALMHCE